MSPKRITKTHQRELEALLGRLEAKYNVSLSLPTFDIGYMPFSIALGQKNFDVRLGDWGSGTKNRTLILLALFRARQMSEAEPSASKITPIIVIEEPESFLHPSAQAEFGRVLYDIAAEFDVQVIATTHSPYLLNKDEPKGNILLERRIVRNQLRETQHINTTGEKWMEPFGVSLGLSSDEFRPWRSLFMSGSDSILLVEGDSDVKYLELLRADHHSLNRLRFEGAIVSYEGTGNLQNTVLLRLIRNLYKRILVTYDLDAESLLEKPLQALGLVKDKDYFAIGVDAPGKRNIEGLIPPAIVSEVYASNGPLLQAATSGTKEEQTTAKSQIKKLLLTAFEAKAQPGDDYRAFYALTKRINRVLD